MIEFCTYTVKNPRLSLKYGHVFMNDPMLLWYGWALRKTNGRVVTSPWRWRQWRYVSKTLAIEQPTSTPCHCPYVASSHLNFFSANAKGWIRILPSTHLYFRMNKTKSARVLNGRRVNCKIRNEWIHSIVFKNSNYFTIFIRLLIRVFDSFHSIINRNIRLADYYFKVVLIGVTL